MPLKSHVFKNSIGMLCCGLESSLPKSSGVDQQLSVEETPE